MLGTAERPVDRVQAGGVQPVPGHDGPDPAQCHLQRVLLPAEATAPGADAAAPRGPGQGQEGASCSWRATKTMTSHAGQKPHPTWSAGFAPRPKTAGWPGGFHQAAARHQMPA